MSDDDDSYTTRPELPQFRSAGEVTSYPAPQLRLPDRKTPLPLSPEGTATFPAPVREPTPPPRPFAPKPPRKKRNRPTILFFAACLIFVAVAGTVGLAVYNDNTPTTSTTSPTRLLPLYHPALRPMFLRGMVTVRWSAEGYSAGDWAWHVQLETLARATGATWVELPVLFTAVRAEPGAAPRIVASVPSSASLAQGIAYAHALGLRVFVVPLVDLGDSDDPWIGHLSFPSTTAAGRQAEAGWFAAYWRAYAPYVAAATGEHAEALALATEWSDLAGSVSAEGSWFALIAKVRTAYPSGLLTYDLNWTEAQAAPALPAWEKSPFLGGLGVSAYAPLTATRGPVPATEAAARWRAQVGTLVDRVAAFSGKPVLLSEVGYRATGDAGYHPWEPTSPSVPDQQQQAVLLGAALSGTLADPHILGAFVWGWSDVERFSLSGNGKSQAAVKEVYTR